MNVPKVIDFQVVYCPLCQVQNKLPTFSRCLACGRDMGVFGRLARLRIEDGQPVFQHTKSLSADEAILIDRHVWELFQLQIRYPKLYWAVNSVIDS